MHLLSAASTSLVAGDPRRCRGCSWTKLEGAGVCKGLLGSYTQTLPQHRSIASEATEACHFPEQEVLLSSGLPSREEFFSKLAFICFSLPKSLSQLFIVGCVYFTFIQISRTE